MSDLSTILKKTPNWVWCSFIPIFGGLGLVYAGNKTKTKSWTVLGLSITGMGLILSTSELVGLIWMMQVGTSFYLKKKYLLKTAIQRVAITDRETAQLVADYRGKIDINTASKDELVYGLDLPIVYANEIEGIRQDGFTFTRIEELTEIAGIPQNYVKKIEPLITFSYSFEQDFVLSWRRLNVYSVAQLVEHGVLPEVAKKIVAERDNNGFYNSVADVKNRTKIPLHYYQNLI